MSNNNKYFKCFSARVAQYLCRKGFEIIKTEVNFKKPKYNVYCFEDTEEIRKAFDKFLTSTERR